METQHMNGSYYIRARATGWYVWYQSYSDGKRTQEPIVKLAMRDLGFKPEMSLDEAKAHCKRLNQERAFIKEKIRVAAKRVTELRSVDETLFPNELVTLFQELLKEENFGSEEHLKKLYSHFNFVQEMVKHLRLHPSEYKDKSKRIYRYFTEKKISVNYCCRIISVLNRWGKFYSKQTRSYYDEVLNPRGNPQSAIADAQKKKRGKDTDLGVRTESLPLKVDNLQQSKFKLPLTQYNWLFLSVWLGLRPVEVDQLKYQDKIRIEQNKKENLTVLHIYQSKLRSVAADKRWKKIPMIFAEQQKCIEIIKSQLFERPLNKVIRKHVGKGITCYGGRKNFVDLMLDKDQKIEDISLWLGHADITTTWKHYKNRDNVNFVRTKETIG